MKKKIVYSIVLLNMLIFELTPALAADSRMSEDGSVNLQNLFITNSCVQCDLENGDLTRRDLKGADLRGANLKNTRLQLADLSGANLQGADLTGAQLGGADLSGADLRGAQYAEKGLDGAYLSGTLFGEIAEPSVQVPQNDKIVVVAETLPVEPQVVDDKQVSSAADQQTVVTDSGRQKSQAAAVSKKTSTIDPVVVNEDTLSQADDIERGKQYKQQPESAPAPVESPLSLGEGQPKKTSLIDEVVIAPPVAEELAVQRDPVQNHRSDSAAVSSKREQAALQIAAQTDQAIGGDKVRAVDTASPLIEGLQAEVAGMGDIKRSVLDEELLKRIKRNSGCYKCDLSNYDLRGLDFEGYDFEGTKFSGADLTGADLEKCNLKNTDFTGALLIDTNLRGADFYKASLRDADMQGAKAESALMDGAVLSGVKGYTQNLVELQ